MLVSEEIYIEHGVHIGGAQKLGSINPFIAKRRKDGVYILDIEKIDQALKRVINRLASVEPSKLLILPSRYYGKIAASKFTKLFPEIKVITDRYIPGSLTNPNIKYYVEPELILVCDPNSESVAIKDANKVGIPVIGLVDTDTVTDGLDDFVPMNNRGRKSLALFFWLLARELYMKHGKIKSYDEFKIPISYFEKLED